MIKLSLTSRVLKVGGIAVASVAAFLLCLVGLFYLCLSQSANSLTQYGLSVLNDNFTGQVELERAQFSRKSLILEGVSLKLDDGEPLANLEKAELDFHWLRGLMRLDYMAVLGDLRLHNLDLTPEIDKDGRFNFAQLKSTKPKKDKKRWPWEQYFSRYEGSVSLDNGSAFFRDWSRGDFCAQLDKLNLLIIAQPDHKAEFEISLVPLQKANSWASENGKVELKGKIRLDMAPDFDATLNLVNIDLVRWSEYYHLPKAVRLLGAQLNSNIWANCKAHAWSQTLEKLNYGGHVKLSHGSIMATHCQEPIENIVLEADIISGLASIKRLSAQFADALLSAGGKVYIWSPSGKIKDWQGRVKLDATVPELQLRKLSRALGIKVPISGKISTELNVDGTLRNPGAKGKIKSAKLTYADKEISQLSIDVSWKDKLLTIESLKAQAAQGNIQGHGYALFEGSKPQLVFNLDGQDLSLQGISPVGGHVGQFKVSMVGTADSPFVYGEGSGVGGFSGAASMLGSASAQFMVLGDTVSLNNVRAYTNLGQASVPYASYNYKHPYLYASVQTDNLSLPSVSVPSIGSVSGTVSGRAQVMGVPTDLNSLSVCAYSQSTNLSLGNLQINNLHGAVGLDRQSVYLPQMSGQVAGGSVYASGWIGLKGGTSSVSILARDVNIAPFADIVQYDIPLKLNGVGDMGASWFANGSDHNNWISLYVEGQTGHQAVLQEAAAHTMTASDGRAAENAAAESTAAYNEPNQVGLEINPEPTPVPTFASETTSKADTLIASSAGVATEQLGTLSFSLERNEVDSQAAMQKLGLAYNVAPGFSHFEEPNGYAAAVQGFVGKQGLGFVGWAKDLALDGRRLTQDLSLEGRLTGRFGAWGQPKNLALSYFTAISGSPVKLVDQHTLWLAGRGVLKNGCLSLQDNILAWNYWPRSGWEAIPHLEGSAYAFLGPDMARPLQQNGLLYSWLPEIGLVKVEGDIMLGTPLSYQLAAEATGIDIAWLHEQNWLAQAADLLDKANITGGQANLYAKIGSERGTPKILPGTWAYIPWFTAGSANNSRIFSGAVSLSSEVAIDPTANGKATMGEINFERLLVSSAPRDKRLFQAKGRLANYDSEPIPSGLLQAKGRIDGGQAALNIKAKDWNSDHVMALLPGLEEHGQKFSGWLGTDELDISFDSKRGLLDTLSMEGSMYFHDGHLLLADSLIPIDRLSAQVSRDSNKLVFSDLNLLSGNFLFQGSGWRSSSGRLETKLYAKDIALDSLSYFDPALSDLHGSVDLALCVESDDLSFRAVQAVLAMEGKDVTWGSVPVSLYFPDFKMGTVKRAENGELYTAKGFGIAASYKDGRIYVNIPSEAVKFSAYRFFEKVLLPKEVADRLMEPGDENQKGFRPHPALDNQGEIIGARLDKEPVSFSVSGDFNFSPSFNSGGENWFLGPDGPDFGNGEQPLVFSLKNFQGNMARAALGLPMSQRRFSFSGELGLKGQWYRGHLAEAPAGSLRYNFDISQLAFGSVTIDKAENIEKSGKTEEEADKKQPRRILWRGLTLKQNLKGAYSREEKAGRFIIEPFEFVPEKHSFGPEGKDDESLASGSVSGSANLALTRLPWRSSSIGNTANDKNQADSSSKNASIDANELHLKISQVPISELGSFLFPSLNSGFVEDFVLNASGPIYSPVFNMLFNVTNGKAGNLDLASITGAVSGRRDPQSKLYQVKLGTSETAFRNERIKDIVSQGLQELGNVEDYAAGIKVYFGKEKKSDRVFSISGTLPYEVTRVRPKDDGSLVPFWRGTSVSLDGAVDINAELKDKDLGLLSSVVSDVSESAGNMLGTLHIGGTLLRPEAIGELKVIDGQIEHKKVGTISDLNIEANFSEILDSDLKNKYIEQKKRNYIAEHGFGAVLAEHLSRKAQENSSAQNSDSELKNDGSKEKQVAEKEQFEPLDFSDARFNRIELRKFSGKLGDKNFVMQGRADMDGFTPMDVDLSFTGEQLPLRWGSLFEGRADVDLHLSKADVSGKDLASWKESLRTRAAARPRLGISSSASKAQVVPIPKMYYLSGKISVPRGDVSVDVSTLTSSSGASFDWSKLPLDYRIDVNIGEDVWMHALGCRIRAAGELAVVPDKDTGKPVVDGEVDLSRGLLAIPLYDLKFKVRSGKAVFNHSQIPELREVTADAQVDNYEITAFVSGAYPNIKVDFVSNPPLAEKEIQNLLALGGFAKYTPSNSASQMVHAPGNTTGSQAVSTDLNLSTSGISMLSKILSSPLTQEISRMLFLSDFSVDITSPHGYSFKIAKSIDSKDRFLFTLTRSLNTQTGQDESVYGIEWRFKNNMLFRLGFDQDGYVRPWFQGFWEF